MSTRTSHGTGAKSGDGAGARNVSEATPLTGQRGRIIQPYGTLVPMKIGVSDDARKQNVDSLNTLLADTITLREMYKKAHWQMKGETFYPLHLLFDKHFEEQVELVDMIAERIQMLGGVSNGMPGEVVKIRTIQDPPGGVEEIPEIIGHLLDAHTTILEEGHKLADQSSDNKDWGTNDLMASEIIRVNQMQYWFTSQHLINTPLVVADRQGEN